MRMSSRLLKALGSRKPLARCGFVGCKGWRCCLRRGGYFANPDSMWANFASFLATMVAPSVESRVEIKKPPMKVLVTGPGETR